MNNRRRCQHFGVLLLVIVCLIVSILPLGTQASSTTLTILYDDTCQLELKFHGKGTVQLGDNAYSKHTTLEVSRYAPLTLTFTPATGRELEIVTINGVIQQNVTTTLTLNDLPASMEVEVWFTSTTVSWFDNPRTGDSIFLPMAALLAAALALAPLRRKKA